MNPKRLFQFLSAIISLLYFVVAVAPAHSFEPSTPVIKVETFGTGEPVILIPGLMSDGSVWNETVQQLRPHYQVLVVNVAGFGDTPKAAGTNALTVEQAIVDYIHQHKLDEPIVIGHSFGGFMAMALAVNPQVQVKKVVSVDGLPYVGPVFTRTNTTTVDDLRAQASQILARYKNFSNTQLEALTQSGIAVQATSEEAQQKVLAFARMSDPATVGQLTHDLLMRDLRPSLAGEQTPILLLGASGGFQTEAQHQFVANLYSEQLANTPHAQVIMNTQARHFIMYDDPQWLAKQICDFIGKGS